MAIRISGTTGIDMGNTSVSNASQVEVQEEQVTPYSGFKNYIINGNFDVWQRGISQTSYGYGSDDRWGNYNNGSTKTHSQITCTDTERALFNASKFSRTVVSSVVGASNFVLKQQAIEDITKLAGKTVTLSFWAKADSSKNIEVRMLQVFGSGGSPSASVYNIGQQLVSLTSTWQKKTITITVPSIIGKTLGTDGVHTTASWLRFTFDAGSGHEGSTVGQQSGTFDIAQVQLEEGSVATPFENRPYGLELSLCQRYLVVINNGSPFSGIVAGGAVGNGALFLNTPIRTLPTITYTGGWTLHTGLANITFSSVTLIGWYYNTINSLEFMLSGLSTGSPGQSFHLRNASGTQQTFILNAEL